MVTAGTGAAGAGTGVAGAGTTAAGADTEVAGTGAAGDGTAGRGWYSSGRRRHESSRRSFRSALWAHGQSACRASLPCQSMCTTFVTVVCSGLFKQGNVCSGVWISGHSQFQGNTGACLELVLVAHNQAGAKQAALAAKKVEPQLEEVVAHWGSHLHPGSLELETRERVSCKH